jgi:hypothetical protein
VSDHSTNNADHADCADHNIGPVILQCRVLPPMRWVATQGLGIFGAYVAMPLGIIPFFASWPALGAVFLFQESPQWAKVLAFGLVFVPVYTALAWLVYLHPRADHLVFCKNGFDLRITFKQRRVLFSELAKINFGLQSTVFEAIMSVVELARPRQMAMIRELASAALNLHFKDGSKITFKSFLHRFEPQDLQQFLAFVAEQHPGLCQEDDNHS